jgi:gliding motility-associated-like protein
MELIPRYNHASKIAFICLVFFIQSYESLSQFQMQIPPGSTQYTGFTRGYWFEAPADFTIVGLRVPTDASSASQSIAVVRFNGGAPPLYNSTTNNFTLLALYQNISGNSIISVNLPISDGDYIGVLGSRGSNSINSYGTNNYSTNIGGYPVTLGRLGMQYDLQSTSPIGLWRENSAYIGRVELYYSTVGLISQDSIIACNVDSTQLSPDSSWSSYAWSTGDTTQTTYVSNSGLYYLTVTDMSSNLWTDSVYVNISNPVAQASIIPTDCESTANGVITASGFGGHEPYQYVWSTGSTSASINTLETGLYSLTITDILGCQNDNLFILSALDTIPPSISTQNISVYLDANGEASITASQINNGSTDNCGIDSFAINFSAFDCDDAGVNVVTLTAWDTTGNSSSAASNVTVLDTIHPSVSTQNINVYLDANGEANITASQINNGSADNCGIDSFAISSNAFSCDDAGVNVLTLTAWDLSGNSSSATASVTVLDTIPPSISTQNISVYLDANGEANITASQINNGSADNCGIDSFAINLSTFDCSDTGLNVVTLIAFDASGNVSDSATASANILDTIPPSISTQNISVYLDANGEASITASQINNGSADNCGIASYSLSLDTFDCGHVGSNTITLTITDVHGNQSSDTATVTVLDTIAPQVFTQNAIVYLDSSGQFTLSPATIDSGSWDSCGIDSSWISQTSFDCSAVGDTIAVSLFVEDVSGNSSLDSSFVITLDTIAPTILVQNITVALDSTGNASIDTSMINNGSWDACGIDAMYLSQLNFDCGDVGSNTVTLFVQDINGNIESESATVTILDSIAPSIIIQSLVVYLDSFGQAVITADSMDIGSWDSCGVASISISDTSFDCANHGDTITIIFTATDVNGNPSMDSAFVYVLDTLPPTIVANNDIVYLDTGGQFTLDYNLVNNGTMDACSIDSMYLSDSTFDCSVVDSVVSVWYIAVDTFGNTDSLQIGITVLDTINPTIECLDSIIVNNDTGICGAPVFFDWPVVDDNCSIDSLIQIDSTGLDSGMIFPVGITQLTYAVFDQSGNSDTCSFIIEVIDIETPTLICAADTSICDSIFTFALPNYLDNCAGLDVIQIAGIGTGLFYPVGTTVNTFAVSDLYGNTDTCSFEVLRYDYPSQAEAGLNIELCEATSTDLSAGIPAIGSGSWSILSGAGSLTDSSSNTSEITGLEIGTVTLLWTIENGVCPVENDTLEVLNLSNETEINAGLDQVICDTNSAVLNAVDPALGFGTWSHANPGVILSDSSAVGSIATNLAIGDYEFYWTVENGVCPVGTDTVAITISPYPSVFASEDTYIFPPSSVEISGASDLSSTYLWFTSSGDKVDSTSSITVSPITSTTYIVRGITPAGCYTQDSVTVGLNEALDLPTAFTPDNDGYNDAWNVKELSNYPDCNVAIYNRWGNKMFESDGYEIPWDGTFKGEQLPSGAYFFVINLNIGEIAPITGSITIIR